MKKKKKEFSLAGFGIWLWFGLGSIIINWENIIFYIIGTYLWISFVEVEK